MPFNALTPLSTSPGAWIVLLVIATTLFSSPGACAAEPPPGPELRALPGGPCRVKANPSWKKPEQWAWGQICKGEIANFNDYYGKALNANAEADWNEEEKERRRLSPNFLRTILTRKPWKEAITEQGVRIGGAYFPTQVDLDLAGPICQLYLISSRLAGGFTAYDLKTAGVLSLQDSWIGEELKLVRAETGSDLFLRYAQVMKDADLNGIKVGGQLSLTGATFEGNLDMISVFVGAHLLMNEGTIVKGKTVIRTSKVAGQVAIDKSTFYDEVDFDSLEIADSIYMRGASFMNNVRILSAKLGGQLNLAEGLFQKDLEMDSMVITSYLIMRKGKYNGKVKMYFTQIGGQLLIEGAKFQSLNLTGSKAEGIICEKDDRPASLKLDRFFYGHLGGLGEGGIQDHMTAWPASWFIDWLALQADYSPQPYEQCAKVLREAGQPGKADDVLFAGKQREREEAWKNDKSRWLWLSILRWTTGYGLGWRYFLSLIWLVLFVGLGTWVVSTAQLDKKHSKKWMVGFSLAKLLPLVNLGKNFEDVVNGWQQGYFIFHQLMGWVLASFIVAGLAGLTK